MSTATIIILSDPNGGEEALGRMFNGLAAAYDFKRRGRPVQVVFQGTGTRWPGELAKSQHPAHALFKAVEDTIGGASAACSALFGARDSVEAQGIPRLGDNTVPGTEGLPAVSEFAAHGSVLVF